jgi:tRNA A-37 threonylcarbamoyl transferase component Bud32
LHARRLAEDLDLPVPKLEAIAPDGTWFSENYISGTPLNRLDDPAAAQRVLAEMKSALGRLSRHTMQETSVGAYVDELAASIRRHIDGNKLLDAAARDVWAERLRKMLRRLESAGERSLRTSLSHGDFQPANILHHGDSSSSWLIDWELSARRQAGYDALVYAMRSRSSVNLAARLRDFREGVKVESSWLLEDWPGAEWESGEARRLSATLLLVEDLAMQLEENANPRFVCLGEGLTLLGAEIDQWNDEAED